MDIGIKTSAIILTLCEGTGSSVLLPLLLLLLLLLLLDSYLVKCSTVVFLDLITVWHAYFFFFSMHTVCS